MVDEAFVSNISATRITQANGIHAGEVKPKAGLWLAGFAFIIGYIFSRWYLYIYYLGDAEHYALFYNSLYGMDPKHWASLQRSYLGSAEPLYRYVIGAAAYFGIDRITYLSMWNGLLTGSIAYILSKNRSSLLFAALIFSNYYLLIILGPAERLKFSYIALALAACVSSIRLKYLLSILAVFFHTQSLAQFVASAGHYVTKNYRSIFTTPLRTMAISVAIAASLAAAGYIFMGAAGSTLAAKSAGYASRSGGLGEIVQWAMLLAGGLLVFRDKIAYAVGMLPIGILTYLYGNRINVAALVLFAFLALAQRKTNHPIVLAVMAYMSFKSISFISDVMRYGTGF